MTELVPIPSPGVPLAFGNVGDPLVLVVPDWYGRLPGVVGFAEALVRPGFRVVVPDLFDGVGTTDADTARQLLDGLDLQRVLAILDDEVTDARSAGSTRVAVVGFSAGGQMALLYAQRGGADAVVAYCASLRASEHRVIPCPTLLQFAEYDYWEDGQDPDLFIDRLKGDGTPVNRFDYLGTRHGFANATIAADFDRNAAALAYARTARFLEKHLIE